MIIRPYDVAVWGFSWIHRIYRMGCWLAGCRVEFGVVRQAHHERGCWLTMSGDFGRQDFCIVVRVRPGVRMLIYARCFPWPTSTIRGDRRRSTGRCG